VVVLQKQVQQDLKEKEALKEKKEKKEIEVLKENVVLVALVGKETHLLKKLRKL
jgi:hypothetical protein